MSCTLPLPEFFQSFCDCEHINVVDILRNEGALGIHSTITTEARKTIKLINKKTKIISIDFTGFNDLSFDRGGEFQLGWHPEMYRYKIIYEIPLVYTYNLNIGELKHKQFVFVF